jgi:hypothetical protein
VLVTDTDIPLWATESSTQPVLLSVQYIIQDAAHTHGPLPQPPISMAGAPRLPLYLGLVSQDRKPTEMELTVIGTLSKGKPIVRVHNVRFQPGRVLEVPLHLWAKCQTVQDSCTASETCGEYGCMERTIDSPAAWNGSPSGTNVDPSGAGDAGREEFDGGVHAGDGDHTSGPDGAVDADDGDGDTGDGDTGDGDTGDGDTGDAGTGDGDTGDGDTGDGDNGRDDSGVAHAHDAGMSLPDAGSGAEDAGAPVMCGGADLTSDPLNCGRCGWKCGGTHATGACVQSQCVCESKNFGDCRADKPGCETDLTSWKTCGACDIRCEPSSQRCDPQTYLCVPK